MSAPRYSASQKHQIVQRYMQGDPIKEIARDFGCDASYPALLAKRRGMSLRLPGDRRESMRNASEVRLTRIAIAKAKAEAMRRASEQAKAIRSVEQRAPDPRSTVGRLMGDPPPGRSALDQKRAAECQ